jgi:hypothetical protein
MTTAKMKTLIALSIIILVTLSTTTITAMASEIPRITKEEAKKMLDDPGVVFLDVRSGSDWRASEIKISGAVYEKPGDVEKWVSTYDPEKTYILYCA